MLTAHVRRCWLAQGFVAAHADGSEAAPADSVEDLLAQTDNTAPPLPNFRVTERHLIDIVDRLKAMEADLKIGGPVNSQDVRYSAASRYPNLPENSPAGRVLTPELYAQLFAAGNTRNDWNVDKALQAGIDATVIPGTQGPQLGVEAGDAESYDLLAPLLAPLIKEHHGFDMASDKQRSDRDADHLVEVDGAAAMDHVLSTHITASRNIRNFCFSNNVCRGERRRIASIVRQAMEPTHGTYTAVTELSDDKAASLREGGLLFEAPGVEDVVRGVARDYPDSRDVFVTEDERTSLWVNADDHVRVSTACAGLAPKKAFKQTFGLLAYLEENIRLGGLRFATHPVLGFVGPNPALIGTALEARVRARLPRLSARPGFAAFCKARGVSLGDQGGATKSSTVSLANAKCLGVTEVEAVNTVVQFVEECVALENELQAGGSDVVSKVDAKLAAAAN